RQAADQPEEEDYGHGAEHPADQTGPVVVQKVRADLARGLRGRARRGEDRRADDQQRDEDEPAARGEPLPGPPRHTPTSWSEGNEATRFSASAEALSSARMFPAGARRRGRGR